MKRTCTAAALVAALALLAGCGPSKKDWEAKLKEVSDLQSQIAQLTADYDAKVDGLKKENEDMRGQLDVITKDKSTLEGLVAQLKKQDEQAKERLKMLSDMLSKFKSLIESGKLKVQIRGGKMVLELPSAILFESGKANLSEVGEATLAQVASVLATIKDREFQVVGHTDNVPIKTKQFPSNWELSTARAVAVVKFLQEQGVSPANVSAAGYSEFQPVGDNGSEEGKASNRRIEIVVMPNLEELPDMGDLEKMIQAP